MLLESSASLEAQWLRRIGAGDRAAFADLYDRYSKPLYSFALRVVNNPKDAEDVLQEVFLKIWEKAAGFDEDIGTPFTWAVSMTRHKAIDHLRSRRRREHVFPEAAVEVELSQIPAASPTDFCRDESAQIRGAVNGLPGEQRRAIEMAFFGGMTHMEIAEVLQEPIGTIKARIRCGMLRLRDLLKDLTISSAAVMEVVTKPQPPPNPLAERENYPACGRVSPHSEGGGSPPMFSALRKTTFSR